MARKKRDLNQRAAHVVRVATGEAERDTKAPDAPPDPTKDPAAVSLGRKGGKKGGPARAKKLSPARRRAIARKAARARWKQ